MEQGIKILIIEDDPDVIHYLECVAELLFGAKVILYFATKLDEGFNQFNDLSLERLDMVFIDACLESQKPDTIPLVKYIAKLFAGPIYAMSGNNHFNQKLILAGCNGVCSKRELPHRIEEFLQEELQAS